MEVDLANFLLIAAIQQEIIGYGSGKGSLDFKGKGATIYDTDTFKGWWEIKRANDKKGSRYLFGLKVPFMGHMGGGNLHKWHNCRDKGPPACNAALEELKNHKSY